MTGKVGYFARVGFPAGKIHIINMDGRPACNRRAKPRGELLICAQSVVLEYINCKACQNLYTKRMVAQAEKGGD